MSHLGEAHDALSFAGSACSARQCASAAARSVRFARDVVAHRPFEPRVEEQVGAVGLGRLEAARDLVLAAGAAFEHLHAAPDALVDRVVEADVEVQEAGAPRSSPSSGRKDGVVETTLKAPATSLPSRARSHHQLQVLGHALEDAAVERAVEPARGPTSACPRWSGAGRRRRRPSLGCGAQLVAAHGADARCPAAPARRARARLVALLRVEARQELVGVV